jgi:hypothetical protein
MKKRSEFANSVSLLFHFRRFHADSSPQGRRTPLRRPAYARPACAAASFSGKIVVSLS